MRAVRSPELAGATGVSGLQKFACQVGEGMVEELPLFAKQSALFGFNEQNVPAFFSCHQFSP